MDVVEKVIGLFKEKRYHVEVTSDFPKQTERSVFLGKVAENTQSVYVDVDQLTKHTVIAGITGGGKTIAGNVIVEDALRAGASALIIDPTAQWTGIIKENADIHLKKEFDKFHMHNDEVQGIPTRIIPIDRFEEALDLEKIMTPGVATVVSVEHLTPVQVEKYVCKLIEKISAARLPSSKKLRLLLVFDEIHIILPKFGGTGEGFTQIERATREFREFGVGLLLLSQVLEDFLGAIRGNINTEMQMRTTFDEDLDKARLKYGDAVANSIMAAQTGTGLFHNADYNLGRPFFLAVRPPRHNPNRLSNDDLQEYLRLAAAIRIMRARLDFDKKELIDAMETNLMYGKFKIARQYLSMLQE